MTAPPPTPPRSPERRVRGWIVIAVAAVFVAIAAWIILQGPRR